MVTCQRDGSVNNWWRVTCQRDRSVNNWWCVTCQRGRSVNNWWRITCQRDISVNNWRCVTCQRDRSVNDWWRITCQRDRSVAWRLYTAPSFVDIRPLRPSNTCQRPENNEGITSSVASTLVETCCKVFKIKPLIYVLHLYHSCNILFSVILIT